MLARPIALVLLIAFTCAACVSWRLGPGDPPAASQTAQPVVPEEAPPSAFAKGQKRRTLADIYVLISCASANNASGRWSEPAWVQLGLPKMVDEIVIPRYREGYRRFYVDSPFGKDTDEKGGPQFTFFGSLRVGQESPWRKGFVDAWLRANSLSGIKVIAYLGNPYGDAEFKRVLAGPDGRNRAMKMMRDAVAPILAAKFHGIGVDASFDTDEDSPLGELLKEWQSQGIEVFTEATPTKKNRWLARFGTIRTVWFARHISKDPKLLNPNECLGERIQAFDGHTPWPETDGRRFDEWVKRWVRQCLDNGEHPALSAGSLKGDPRTAMGLD